MDESAKSPTSDQETSVPIVKEEEIDAEKRSENEDSERTATTAGDADERISLLEKEISQMQLLLTQKDELASLYDREKKILEKEKCAVSLGG